MNLDALRLIFLEKGKIVCLKKNYSTEEKNYLFHIEFEGGDTANFFANESGGLLPTSKLLPAITWFMRDKNETKNLTEKQYYIVVDSYLNLCEQGISPKKKTKRRGKSSVDYLNEVNIKPDFRPCILSSLAITYSSCRMPNFKCKN